MMSKIIFSLLVLLAGCASLPNAPGVLALPGTGLSLEQFQGDDVFCRQYARGQIGGASANQADGASSSVGAAQQHYDIAYIQCMYSKGHRVPVSGQYSDESPHKPANPAVNIPPPPPGPPPPPPSR